MYTPRKILPLLLATIAILCCKKKTNVPAPAVPVDAIIGTYVGSSNYDANDTIYIMKKTDNSFCCYASKAPYPWPGENLTCFDYNSSNSYIDYPYPTEIIFSPQKDSMYYHHTESYTSSGGVGHSYEVTFTGKK